MGDDCIEGGAVIHKERPDVGVFIFQMGEGIVENSSDSIRGGPVGPVGILQGVQGVWYAALNVGQHHSLKALHNDWSECYWSVVIQAAWWALLWNRDDGCGLETGGNCAKADGKVEDGCENISQLVGACSESSPRDVIWSGCLARVDVPQDSVYLS